MSKQDYEILAQAEWENLISNALESMNLDADKEAVEQTAAFVVEMLEVNRSLNLTGLTDSQDVLDLHLKDSWTLLSVLDPLLEEKPELSFLDLGTGAGFPGMPVKILRPSIHLILMDALAKRIRFLEESANKIKLAQPWFAVHVRAEEAARNPKYRENIDFVTARAVADLRILLEYALPLVKPGGHFVAMKAECEEELQAALPAMKKLGGELVEAKFFCIPGTEVKRSLIVVRKAKACAKRFPRSNASIKKNPL